MSFAKSIYKLTNSLLIYIFYAV